MKTYRVKVQKTVIVEAEMESFAASPEAAKRDAANRSFFIADDRRRKIVSELNSAHAVSATEATA